MFGYIVLNKNVSQEIEEIYRSYYCSLCFELKKYGQVSRLTLNNDMTFLSILLTSLYDDKGTVSTKTCFLHPKRKISMISNQYIEYCADMTIILAYFKAKDDVDDEKKHRLLYTYLKRHHQKNLKKYREKIDFIENKLIEIQQLESQNTDDIDALCHLFGDVMKEIVCMKDDYYSDDLKQFGYYLGQFIYLYDAYDDIEYDIRHHQFNPLISKYKEENFDDYIFELLKIYMSEAVHYYERLPLIDNTNVMNQILYSGVWSKYHAIKEKRHESL